MLMPDDLIDSNYGKAGLLARCILSGLVEPHVEMTPLILGSLAEVIADELKSSRKTDFMRKMPRALKWAVRPDVTPEFAILAVEHALAARSPTQRRVIRGSREYGAYRAKFGTILDEVFGA